MPTSTRVVVMAHGWIFVESKGKCLAEFGEESLERTFLETERQPTTEIRSSREKRAGVKRWNRCRGVDEPPGKTPAPFMVDFDTF